MGYNLQKYGTLSLDYEDKINPKPTAYREPIFPTYLAIVMKLVARLRQMNMEQLYENAHDTLRLSLIPLLIIIAFITMYAVYRITKNILLSYISIFLIACSFTSWAIRNYRHFNEFF